MAGRADGTLAGPRRASCLGVSGIGDPMRSLKAFEALLAERLRTADLQGNFASEGDLERRVVLPLVRDVLMQDSGPHIYAHPWNQPETCQPNCTEGRGLIERAVLHGCPDCWNESKEWAAVRLYGLHCFDLVVGDRNNSFVLELKLLRRARSGNRRANDGFQRLLGQCLLARLVHASVVAFCVAERGALDEAATGHVGALQDQNITLIVKTLGEGAGNGTGQPDAGVGSGASPDARRGAARGVGSRRRAREA